MTLVQLSLVLIVLGVVMLFVVLCTQGFDILKYIIYRGRTEATVYSVEKFDLAKSKRVVWRQVDGKEFIPINSTQDRSFHRPPTLYGRVGKTMQASIKWSAEDTNWRANYPYLRKKGGWKVGEDVMIHYSTEKPWKYAMRDRAMWIGTLLECILYIVLIIIGVVLFANQI